MVKMQKSRSGYGVGWGGQGGCEQRIEVIVKTQRKSHRVSGWVVRVDVNKELKLF